ncbi:MAG: Eco57I restriction-modification methylase domain-containing protein [Sedimentisphaerales bacterium]|nr:Eco57I restriction-modification methylase domain-containing protein [Sedimentisphaerales bacterium]
MRTIRPNSHSLDIPNQKDGAAVARIMYFTYRDYLHKWDSIAEIFSKDAILKGSFDKFTASAKGKRGTTTVDVAFLAEIEKWRDMLAKIIALRNRNLSQPEINFAVQCTIDRILFLRMCEDRGIERYGQLQAISSGDRTYPRLCEIFEKADQKYNSGLFHFHDEPGRTEAPDKLTPGIAIDDKDLKWILYNLYYPQCPYEFSVLPPEILGNVYEQFLGKVITLTSAHHAKIEDKPEVKKAGGVYYTPSYIVDYIVKNTVGRLLNDPAPQPGLAPTPAVGGSPKPSERPLTPKQIANLKILDPACGSGSFLLGAYTYLLNYHRGWYAANDPEKWMRKKDPPIYQVASPRTDDHVFSPAFHAGSPPNYRLTIAEKKRILLNNIFGVDIDSQAVEVTKLSLLLKVLEDENSQTLENQYRLFHERALPDLAANIKCGNSLIAPDFFDNSDRLAPGPVPGVSTESSPNNDLYQKINPFDWKQEFPKIFNRKNPGFDAVIGNPPYVRQESLAENKAYFRRVYAVYHGVADLYAYFMERSLSLLSKDSRFGVIVSNKWLRAAYGQPLREYLQRSVAVLEITDLAGLPVFEGATVRTIVLLCQKSVPDKHIVLYAPPLPLEDFLQMASGPDSTLLRNNPRMELPQSSLSPLGWSFSDQPVSSLVNTIAARGQPLREYARGHFFRGVVTGLNKAFIISADTRKNLIAAHKHSSEIIKPLVVGRNVRRYHILDDDKYLIFTRRGTSINNYPAIKDYLSQFRRELTPKKRRKDPTGRKPGSYQWFEIQDSVDYFAEFDRPKIISPDISTSVRFTLDMDGFYGSNTTYCIGLKDLYLLGVLNSKLAQFVFQHICAGLEGHGETYLRFFGQYLEKFPIRTIDFDNPDDNAMHDKMVALVDRMLSLHNDLAAAKIPDEKTKIQRQIDTTDCQIDQLVYNLYNLTDEEIKIVEAHS